jgi:formamidopyrimidine-DNA glycosylase
MQCTFGMSGQWSESEGNHPCLIIQHADPNDPTNEKDMVFNDPRHFGTIKFSSREKDLKNKLNELGWDPLQEDISMWLKYLTRTIQNSDKPIGQLLMDQSIFAGVGNYIRAEALYSSKISPWRKGNKLSATDISNLCDSLVDVMKQSYSYQGATIHTYKDPYGNEGRYSSSFKVYGQEKDSLGNKIIKETTPEGRTIHWCPTIQM